MRNYKEREINGERDRERERVCVGECVRDRDRERVCWRVCERQRQRETE